MGQVRKPKYISGTILGEHLCLTNSRVSQLTTSGFFPRPDPDKGYDLDACRVLYIKHLQTTNRNKAAKRKGVVDDTTGKHESYNDLLQKEKWRKEKRQNDEADRILAPISEITETLAKVAGEIRPKLESIPPEIARSCPDLSKRTHEIIKRVITSSLNSIAGLYNDT